MADKSRRQKPDEPPAIGEQLFAAEIWKPDETVMKPKLIDKPDLPAACFDGLADEHIEQMLNTAEYITRLYVTSFRESARLLAALHEEVPEGNWLAFLDSGALPFNRRTAQDLCSAWSWLKDCDLTDQQLAKAFRSKRALAKVAIAEDDVRQAIEARVLAGEQITEAKVTEVRRKQIPVAPTLEAEPIDVEVVDPRDAELAELREKVERMEAVVREGRQTADGLLDAAEADAELISNLEAENARLTQRLADSHVEHLKAVDELKADFNAQLDAIREAILDAPVTEEQGSTFDQATRHLQGLVTYFHEHRDEWSDEQRHLFDQMGDGLLPLEEEWDRWTPGPKVNVPNPTALSIFLPTHDHTDFWAGLPEAQQQQIIDIVESGAEPMTICDIAKALDWTA